MVLDAGDSSRGDAGGSVDADVGAAAEPSSADGAADGSVPAEPGPAGGDRPPYDLRARLATSGRRAAVLVGLTGIAVAQPVLDLFGRTPEFFVAGRHTGSHLVWFALIIAAVPAVVAAVVVTAAELAHPRLGKVVHSGCVGGLAFLFGLVLSNAMGVHGLVTSLAMSSTIAGVAVWAELVHRPVRTILSLTALGNLLFVGMFLFTSEASRLLNPPAAPDLAELAWVEAPEPPGPVVMLILDELPVTTLMNADGSINGERYPNFARLAEGSTWFRNASSNSHMTHHAVPSLLTGTFPSGGRPLPTFEQYPHNLFTMFGDAYPVRAYESVTHMCLGELCAAPARGAMATALKDAAVVFGHQTLPADLRDRLPPVDHTWGNFAGHDEGGALVETAADPAITDDDPYGRWHSMDLNDTSARTQIRILDEMVADIDSGPGLHLVHVAAPHYPWVLAPEGELTQTLWLERDPPDPTHELLPEHSYQLQSLQVGAVDRSVGELIDHLEAIDAWDDALVVVTSDHGRGMMAPPDYGRAPTDANREELLRVPLFIKAPGQSEGQVRDDVVRLVDVVPSIIDLLDGRTDRDLDGRSLFDPAAEVDDADVETLVDRDVGAALEVAAGHADTFPHGADWVGLAALGDHGGLVGSEVTDHEVGSASTAQLEFADRNAFEELPVAGNRWPRLLLASISGVDGDGPPDLLVAVNGRIAGMLAPYERHGGTWTVVGVTAPFFREGANEVVAYEVEGAGAHVVLRPVPEG